MTYNNDDDDERSNEITEIEMKQSGKESNYC